jgi:hypothetical protein
MEIEEKLVSKKKRFLIAAIAAVLLVAATGSASANCIGDVTSTVFGCGDTVTESCTFNADMTCYVCGPKYGDAQYGLKVGADGITIDGNRYALTGNVTGEHCDGISEANPGDGCCGIYDYGYDGVTIKNLEISNFCNGIGLDAPYVDWDEWLHDVTIESCDIHHNGVATAAWSVSHGIHATEFRNSTVINNIIHDNTGTGTGCGDGGNGMFVYGTRADPNYLLIHNNTFNDNRKSGFIAKMMMRNSTVSNNTACGNGFGDWHECAGINFRCVHTSYNEVKYNNCSSNDGSGIYIGGQYNDVRNNPANDNEGPGIFLGRSDGGSSFNILSYNDVWRNAGAVVGEHPKAGIYIVNRPGNELYWNNVCQNAGFDIRDQDTTTGDNNKCDTAYNYCDAGAGNPPPCDYQCGCTGPNLMVQDKHETWVNATHYNIIYTVCNLGNVGAGSTSSTGIYIDGNFKEHAGASNLAAFSCDPPVTVGPYAVSGIDTIKVCADDLGQIAETKENDNCTENVFGGPDLVIRGFEPVEWVDYPYKRYNLTYYVENIGDKATPAECKVNFTLLGESWDCVDPVSVPAGLQPGHRWPATELRSVGPFVMGGDSDWLQGFVNFEHTFEENVWGDLHGNRERFSGDYTPSCCICGDVTGEGTVSWSDGSAVVAGNIATCNWAADVDCSYGVSWSDGSAIVSGSLNCCGPGPVVCNPPWCY